MVGGVRQPKVRNLEKISKFLIPPLFTFFGRAGPPSAPGHHTTVASRRFDRRAPSPDRRLHFSVARPTGIAAARLAHQRPVRRPSSSAQVPPTAPTVLTLDGWPYPRRDSHTRGQSLDCLPAHKSRRRHPPSPRPADSSSARLPTIHRSPPKKEYSLLGANGIWDSQMVTHFGTSQTRPCLTAGS